MFRISTKTKRMMLIKLYNFFFPWCSMNNTNEEVLKWEIGQGKELFLKKMRPLTCQERVESHLLPSTSVVGLFCFFPINIWYSLCQSETLSPSNDRCVFNVMSAFIVGGQMTVTLAPRRRANRWCDSVSWVDGESAAWWICALSIFQWTSQLL